MTTRNAIDELLGVKRLAVVGVSRNPKDFTRRLFREMRSRGYDLVPVHPEAAEVEGVPAVARVADASPPVDAALLLTKPAVTGEVVRQCHAAGIRRIWMYRAVGAGAVNPQAVDFCQTNGMTLVAGECPFMFLPGSGFPHNFHASCRKLLGSYPK
jgi:predicted CoA-binding protein